MEIQKINDNQIKFILNKIDLKERNIKISELAFCSEKTEELFKEMMTQAMIQHDFHFDNTPLMIEAIPASSESIIIVVTKVPSSDDVDDHLSVFDANKNEFAKLKRKLKLDTKTIDTNEQERSLIYSFSNLQTLSDLSKRICVFYKNASTNVYKYCDRYYLHIKVYSTENIYKGFIPVESILSEYGQKHICVNISQTFLEEHGETIIKENALSILATYL